MAGYGYVYELNFDGWLDVSPLVNTKNTQVTFNAFGNDLKGSRDVSKITLMHGKDPRKSLEFHSDVYRRLLEAKNNRAVVRFRMLHGTEAVFTGNVDLGNLKQSTGSIPEEISLEIEDISYLLDKEIPSSVEYPDADLVDAIGNIIDAPIFSKTDPANSIVVKLLMLAGYSVSDIDFNHSNSVMDGDSLARVRFVYDVDDKKTFRDRINTMLMEHRCILTNNADGTFCIRRTFITAEQQAPTIPAYLIKDKITSAGGDYQKDGVAVKWSSLAFAKKQTVYQASVTPSFDSENEDEGEEVKAEGYWPETGDIEDVWYQYDAKFLDRPYYTKQTRLQNKDLSLISSRNVQYEIDCDDTITEVTESRVVLPKKAKFLFYNSAITIKRVRGFNVLADVLFRKKISTYTSPEASTSPEDYESEFVFNAEAADYLASHMFLMHNHGDMTYTWTQKADVNILDVFTVQIPGTAISTKAIVKNVTKTYPTAGLVLCKVTAIGIAPFDLLPSKKVAWINGSGKKGDKGETLIHQWAVGDNGDIPPTFVAVLSENGEPIGYTSPVGFMDQWYTTKPSVPADKYLWHRYRYPSDSEWIYIIETRPVSLDAPYSKIIYKSAAEKPATPSGDCSTIPSGWSTTPPERVEGQTIWASTGNVTWTSINEPVYSVWSTASAWSGDKGDTGESGAPARAINLYSSSNVINFSSRGELKTQQIEITCLPSNLPISDAVWTATDEGSLSQIEIAEGVFDQYRRILDCSLVTGDSTLISVSIVFEGVTYSGIIGITKVADGTPSPLYLDAQSSVPTLTTEGPLVSGDFFLYIGPYSGPNSDPGDQGLNPPALEINEFVYGRIYEYLGKNAEDEDQWKESRKSEHLAAAQKDALQIAKDSNTYMFVAVLVAQLGLFFDLIVAGILKSTNYAEDASGVPTAGFKLDGIRGLIKALGLEAYSAMIYGNLEASGFRTLQEEAGTTIAVASITPTIWKQAARDSIISYSTELYSISGTVDGYSFTKATRRNNDRILLASHHYESERISAGETHYFTQLYPSKVFGLTFKCDFDGYYAGLYSNRGYWAFIAEANSNLETAHFIRSMGESYRVFTSYSFPSASYTNFTIKHSSGALWGERGSYVDHHFIWTDRQFTGLVLVDGESSYKVIDPNQTAHYLNSKTWTIGSYNQDDLSIYRSGTDFYNLFSSLAIGADGFCDGGQINVNGTLYTVTRLTKAANSITFYTSGGVITVNKFQEGTNVGVYTELAVTQAINFQTVAGGIETKHIFPWGTQAGSPGVYDIGTANERFNTAYLSGVNIKPAGQSVGIPPLLTRTVNGYPGIVHSDGTDNNYIRTPVAGLIPYNSGGSGYLGTDSWPFNYGYFKNLISQGPIYGSSVNTGYGDNEVTKSAYEAANLTAYTTETYTLSAFQPSEMRYVKMYYKANYTKRFRLPSGGSYLVLIWSRQSGSSWSAVNTSLIYSGSTYLYNTDSSEDYEYFYIIRRIDA